MKYPITKCYHPRVIQNKYTGELVEVGCGVCKACLMSRANKMSFLCSMEEQQHKYCMFVTLTYAPEFAPLMFPYLDEVHNVILWYSSCERLGQKGDLIAVDNECNHRVKDLRGYLALLREKTDLKHELHGAMTYVNKRDVQLFLKRLRKNLIKFTDEKIRYYAVSEYGPKTYRAHYHLLLFYDEARTQEVMSKLIRKSWPFGRVDCSLSRGKCSSYVSRYVNSNYFIPPFLGGLSSKPFSLHSRFFAQGIYRSKKAEIYANDPAEFVSLGGELDGRYVEFMPWRSLACTFFPKCKGYNRKSDSELWRSYNILREVKAFFGSSFDSLSLPQIAQNLLDAVVNYKFPNDYTSRFKIDERCRSLLDWFSSGMEHNPYIVNHYSSDDAQYFTNSILSELYTSKHFLCFVCDNSTYRERKHKFDLIRRFWSKFDYKLLTDMYLSQIEFSDEMDDFSWFYVNNTHVKFDADRKAYLDMSKLSKEKFYQSFVIKSDADFERSIKHKRLNDANYIFCNY